MPKKIMNRRQFVAAGAGAGVLASKARVFGQAPAVITSVKPVVVSAGNGNRSKDTDGLTCVAKAFKLITSGSDVLDAVVAGVNIVELDPNDSSVGYGGLPNADGVVQLDSSVMHGPKKMGGCVACLEGVRTPSLVAKKVMEETDHVLLVGKGAQNFARMMGFTIEDDLNTQLSRQRWLEWKQRTDPLHYIPPNNRGLTGPGGDPAAALRERERIGMAVTLQMAAEGKIDLEHIWGTINCNGVNSKGEVCGVTTTSGLSFKIPGRVGDSPILGAGLYVDGDVGAAGSTGRGELNLVSMASFICVDEMRRGRNPKDAGMTAIQRIKDMVIQKRLLDDNGMPNNQVSINFYVLNKKGEYAGVTLRGRGSFAVCDENGPRTIPMESLLG
jgi:N4-(beta-N-acetylglucosaminyl)-L-asparaginase